MGYKINHTTHEGVRGMDFERNTKGRKVHEFSVTKTKSNNGDFVGTLFAYIVAAIIVFVGFYLLSNKPDTTCFRCGEVVFFDERDSKIVDDKCYHEECYEKSFIVVG